MIEREYFSDHELLVLGTAYLWCCERSRWAKGQGTVPLAIKRASIRFRQARDELTPERAQALERKLSALMHAVIRGKLTGQELKQGLRRQRKNLAKRQESPR